MMQDDVNVIVDHLSQSRRQETEDAGDVEVG